MPSACHNEGDPFVQNLRRGHYEVDLDADPRHRLPSVLLNWPI